MIKVVAAALGVVLSTGIASAQTYPTRSISMIVPFTAGGPTDTVARLIAEVMGRDLGQQVIVENVGGAGGTLGAARVAKAKPDGYTLLLHHIGMATSATLYRKLPYDTLNSFEYVGLVTSVPMTIVARAGFPAADMKGLMENLRANKDKITLANAGIGAASHLCGMLLQDALKTQLTTVPYPGTGPAMTALVGEQVDVMCDQTTNTTGQIKNGKIKAYAVTAPKRLAALPDIPTTTEVGLPTMQFGIWHGVYAPKGTPKDALDKLTAALQKALEAPNVKSRFADLGTEPSTREEATGEGLKKLLESEIARWAPVIKAAGIYAD